MNPLQQRKPAHRLKTWTIYFEDVLTCKKTFELRKDDRDFQVGDWLILEEWNPESKSYTGREAYRRVTYKLEGGRFGLQEGYCILGLRIGHKVYTRPLG